LGLAFAAATRLMGSRPRSRSSVWWCTLAGRCRR
jgi:hypothetical protein